jgi:NADPH:quinone reductase-like Zn-dependent oxidoreductase
LPVKTASIFAESVIELTDGRGADVVLNALAAEAIPMGLSCLAESGRFLEIGKRDIYMNSRIPLWGLRRNSSFHVIAMDAIFAGDEAKTHDRSVRSRRSRRAHRVAIPLLPREPHRRRVPPHGRWQTHR